MADLRRVAAAVCVGTILPVWAPLSEPALQSADDPLWLAVMGGRGHLYPVARLDGESWEVPDWVKPFEVEGVDAPEEAELTPVGDGGWSWSGGLVTRDVPTSWLLYSDEHSGSPLTITGGRLATAHCVFKWALTVDGSAPDLAGRPVRRRGPKPCAGGRAFRGRHPRPEQDRGTWVWSTALRTGGARVTGSSAGWRSCASRAR